MRRIIEGDTGTFKCPTCGGKVLKNTGYCLACKKKVKDPGAKADDKKADDKKDDKKEQAMVVEISKAIKIAQEDYDVILEKGDKIKIYPKAD